MKGETKGEEFSKEGRFRLNDDSKSTGILLLSALRYAMM